MGTTSANFSGKNGGIQIGTSYGTVHTSFGRPEVTQQDIDKDVRRSLAFPEMFDRKDKLDPRHGNTCEWILELEEYRSWRSRPCGLLWIKGKPGAGKSTLMAFLHNTLEGPEKSPETRLEFFFSARGTELQHTSLGMFRSLLNQIFDGDETVRPLVREFYNQRCRLLGGQRTWEWPLNKLEELLADTILASAKRKSIVVFVDALDEAGATSARQLAQYFHQLVGRAEEANLPLQVYISCRHHPIVETAQATEVCVENHNHEDIATYVRDTLAKANVEEYVRQQEMDNLVEHLIIKANRVFQWVHIMVPRVIDDIFEGQTFDEIPSWLSEVPTELKDLYTYILNHMILPKNREQSNLFFKWVCFAERPLTVVEMRYALAAPNAQSSSFQPAWEKLPDFVDDDDRMARKLKALSGGLAEIVPGSTQEFDKIIQVVHESVRDFFYERGLALLYPDLSTGTLSSNDTLISQCQATLYRSCLEYLSTVLLPRKTRGRNSIIEWNALQIYPLLQYASMNTLIHAEKAGHFRVGALQNELSILHQVIPRWVEACHLPQLCPKGPHPRTGTTVLHIVAYANMLDIVKIEVSSGADVMAKDSNGDTPLHFAAQRGHIAAAEILWRQGYEETENEKGLTPLGAAAGRGHLEFVEWLLDKGVSLQAKSGYGLQEASYQGHQDVVGTLLGAGADVNAQGGKYGSALQAAAAATGGGSTEIVQILLDHHADVNAQGGHFGTALQAAVDTGSTEIVQILLDHHADVNAQGGHFGSALHAAASHGETEIAQILLGHHADVNAQGGHFGSALHTAAWLGDTEIAQILLDHHADVNAQGGLYGSALHAAAWEGKTEIVQILLNHHADVNAQGGHFGSALHAAATESTEIFQILLDHHADVNAQGGLYGSALQAAATESTEIFQILLDHHADVNAQGGYYGSALQAAAYHGKTEIAQILLDHHADVNAQGGYYRSALQAAAYRGKTEIAQILLDHHADVNAQGGYYGSALQAAAYYGKTEIVQILLDHRADVNAQNGEVGSPLLAAFIQAQTNIVDILLHAGADCLLMNELDSTSLHFTASKNMVHILEQFPQLATAVNHRDKMLRTPLQMAISSGYFKSAMTLINCGADPSLIDGYGRNVLDWAQGHLALMKEICHHCPSLTLTHPEIQEMCVRQSLHRISDMLSCSTLANPCPVLHQAGRYFLFLNDVSSARHLLRLFVRQHIYPHWTDCSRCDGGLYRGFSVCSICPYLTFCLWCARESPEHTDREVLPDQKHELIEITDVPNEDFPSFDPESESLDLYLSKFIRERLGPNDDVNEIEPSNGSMAHPASDKADPASNPIFSQARIIFAVFFGILAILLEVLLF